MPPLGVAPGVTDGGPVLALGVELTCGRGQVLLALAQAPARSQRVEQALMRPAVEGRQAQPSFEAGDGFVRRVRQRGRQVLQHSRLHRAIAPALRRQPGAVGGAACDVQSFEEVASELRGERAKVISRERADPALQRASQTKRVDVRIGEIEPDRIALSQNADAARLVEHPAQFAQAPAKLATGIVRQVPQKFAQMVSSQRVRGESQVGGERPHLAGGGQRRRYAIAGNAQRPEQMKAQAATVGRRGASVHFHA